MTIPLLPGKPVRLGRGSSGPSSFKDPHVSRDHCELLYEDGKVVLSDIGSASGTWVNGERITQQELKPGDLILIGRTQLAFQWTDGDEKPTRSWHESDD